MTLQRLNALRKSHHGYAASLDTGIGGDPQHAVIVMQDANDRFMSFMFLDDPSKYAWFDGANSTIRDDKRSNEDEPYRWLKKMDRQNVVLSHEEAPFSFDISYTKNGVQHNDTWVGVQLVVRLDPFVSYYD